MSPGPLLTVSPRSVTVAACLLATLFGWGTVAQAARKIQNGPIKFILTPMVLRGRSQAMLPVSCVVNSKDPELLRGTLEMRVTLSERLVHRMELPDFVVTPGDTRFRLTIPEVTVNQLDLAIRAVVLFHVGEDTYDLGEHDLVIPIDSRRQQAVLSIEPKNRLIDRDQQDLRDSLLLHRFAPPEPDGRRNNLVSVPSTIDPGDVPASPLAFLGVDLVVTEPSILGLLKAEQLRALLAWVRAGGALCVVCPPQITSAEVAEFLNGLVPQDDGTVAWQPTGTGTWELLQPASGGVRHGEPGLGRAVIIEDAAVRQGCLESPLWDRSVQFLWRLQKCRESELTRQPGGQVPIWTRPPSDTIGAINSIRFSEYMPVNYLRSLENLTGGMQPSQMSRIPIWQFVVMLAVFLLAVSIGDYYLLGAFRLRRYTWIFLPAVSLGVTWMTARMAEKTLGENDSQAETLVVDIGRQGIPVRSTRFQLTVAAQPKTMREEIVNGLMVSETEAAELLARQAQTELRRQGAYAEATIAAGQFEADIPLSEGLPPYRYTFEQKLKKWSPVLTRLTRVGAPAEMPAFPWEAWRQRDFSDPGAWQNLVQECLDCASNALVWRIRSGRIELLNRVNPGPAYRVGLEQFLLETSGTVPQGQGYFDYLWQVSPTGHSNLEDLRLLDPSDPQSQMVVIAVPREQDLTVYRFVLPQPVPKP